MGEMALLQEMRERKAALRQAALARRDGLDPVARIEMSMALADHGSQAVDIDPGSVVAGFFPIRTEIDLRPLMDRLRERGARLCVPAVIDRTTIVFRELVKGASVVSTGFGTVGPGPEADILDPDIILMPLAAFDAEGNRIGYGAGHYDRAISRLHAKSRLPRLIGCAFSVQEVEAVPAEPHDVKMHAALTEKGLHSFLTPGKS